jgi:uncharacterized protein YyaL (SSP411 family)
MRFLRFSIVYFCFCYFLTAQQKPNALLEETSPYLQSHAYNPVNWYPWRSTFLEKAQDENKLLIISIGYASCHWCHVMAKESFEDETVAKVMNSSFINIKVDREERPDIDQIYMRALQLIKGEGGWPLNVVALPDGRPIYAGTYHSKTQWISVLKQLEELYKNQPEKAIVFADKITKGIKELNLISPKESIDLSTNDLKKIQQKLYQKWDTIYGGLIGTEKFMLPQNLLYNLKYASLSKDSATLAHNKRTLNNILFNGVLDALEGGFYRYSTDSMWQVPHFEKMLYDNAQMLSVYAEAYNQYKDLAYKEAITQTIDFLDNNMRHNNGGYIASLHADSNGMEGGYYVYTEEEIKAIAQEKQALFKAIYNPIRFEKSFYIITKNKLALKKHKAQTAEWNKALVKIRRSKQMPLKDAKIITSWNALLVKGYVDAYRALANEVYLKEAENLFEYLIKNQFNKEALVHLKSENGNHVNAFVEDYAYLADAATALYLATQNEAYQVYALRFLDASKALFYDEKEGLFQYSSNNQLVSKIYKTNDDVLPSPTLVLADNYFKWGHILYQKAYLQMAEQIFKNTYNLYQNQPEHYPSIGTLALNYVYPFYEVAIVGPKAATLATKFKRSKPINGIIVYSTGANDLPLFKGRYEPNQTYIYVCQNNSCKLPVETVEEALLQMDFN